MEGGRGGLLMKVHHALVDGMAAMGMAALVLDPSDEPPAIPPQQPPWQPRKYDMRSHVARLAAKPLAVSYELMIEGMERALDPDPRRAAGDMRRATEVALELARARPHAPMTPLNRPLGQPALRHRPRRAAGAQAGRKGGRWDRQRRRVGDRGGDARPLPGGGLAR